MSKSISRLDHLKSLLALEEKRTALQHQVDELSHQISTALDQVFDKAPATVLEVFDKAPAAVTKTIRKIVRKGRARRGALKAQILAALDAAGDAGVRVTELASSLGTKAANLHAWFHATAKRMPSIVKVAGGHYRLNGHGSKPAKASAAPVKAPKVKGKARKAGKAKRGALSENILAGLSGAGSSGITVKELADKAGTNYRNVAVWFATTGKKNSKIKKVAPATYKLAA